MGQPLDVTVERIVVLERRNSSDIVTIYTTLKDACYPYNEPLTLEFRAAQGSGQDYVRDHFGIEPEVITEGGAR